MSCKYSSFSLGSWLIIWNCILIAGQILILRRKFQPIQLLMNELVNHAIWLDYICRDKNAMHMRICVRAGW